MVKNPEIISEILSADTDTRIKLIRDNANNLSVSDLNEISIKLIKNLSDAMEPVEIPDSTKVETTNIVENTATSKKLFATPKATVKPDAKPLQAQEEEQASEDSNVQMLIIGVVSAMAMFGVALVGLGSDIASLVTLTTWLVFTALATTGKRVKQAMLGSSLIVGLASANGLMATEQNLVYAFDNSINFGRIDGVFIMPMLAIATIAVSLLWKEKMN